MEEANNSAGTNGFTMATVAGELVALPLAPAAVAVLAQAVNVLMCGSIS